MTRRTGLIEGAVAELRGRIVSGEWAVGSRIPAEPALVELLGVGRNTVREAVQSLVHSGLVERRQGSGTYVLSTSELAVSMGRHMVDARQRDVIEVRRALEVEAGRTAARRRGSTEAAELLRLRDERAAAHLAGDMDRLVEADLALHRCVVRAAGNPLLRTLYDNLVDAIGENIRFNFVSDTHGPDAHDGLVEAIVAGDADRAVRETEDYLSEFLDGLPEPRDAASA
ncbi:FadR/GntR family transcriptional regulator [Cellulomonas endophytica]|uniref:FadR/GntR family transcriptional regulator n=1 Tax=Cellulomonas endophytica TaxID=2494735 RepID=UPI0010124DE1|nr:FadR/GntR family transcriptional regulator [Cellulomonas endophytica]